MSVQVANAAAILCTFGTAPGSLIVIRPTILAGTMPMANIMDYIPYTNIPVFAMCTSLANPAVASATSAASGVLTPQPCTPMTSAPWVAGKTTILVDNKPALDRNSTCICSYGGTIQITYPGQTSVVF